jgi:hypothetical protein
MLPVGSFPPGFRLLGRRPSVFGQLAVPPKDYLWAKPLTIQTRVYANDTTVCTTATAVEAILKTICINQTTILFLETTVLANEKRLPIAETPFPVNQTAGSGFATAVWILQIRDSETQYMFFISSTTVAASLTTVEGKN